jgi:hypothetical protein
MSAYGVRRAPEMDIEEQEEQLCAIVVQCAIVAQRVVSN